MRRLPMLLAAVALIASCSSDGSSDGSTTATTAPTPESSQESSAESTDTTTASSDAPTTTPSTEATEGTTTESTADSSDSWTGVTANSIKLGVAGIDPEQVRSFGIDFEGPGAEQLYTAWIAVQNDRGGVLGRSIELAFTKYLPLGDAQAEAACVALTEDAQVFAATGLLLGDTSLCITETHETPYIGLFGQSAERDARAKAPFLAIEMADDRQRSAGVQVFIDDGLLDGQRGRALHGGSRCRRHRYRDQAAARRGWSERRRVGGTRRLWRRHRGPGPGA